METQQMLNAILQMKMVDTNNHSFFVKYCVHMVYNTDIVSICASITNGVNFDFVKDKKFWLTSKNTKVHFIPL